MSSFYFEVSDIGISIYGSKYFVMHNTEHDLLSRLPIGYMLLSNRIWKKSNNDITFIKHRGDEYENITVDMEEFFLIMMTAIPIE